MELVEATTDSVLAFAKSSDFSSASSWVREGVVGIDLGCCTDDAMSKVERGIFTGG